jgi:tetratricopeptide (TPR) repeat protein
MILVNLLETGKEFYQSGRYELYDSGRYERAIEYFDKAKQVIEYVDKHEDKDPIFCQILDDKAVSLNYLGKYKEAEECADEAIGIDGNDAKALAVKAEALNYLGESSNAKICADKAIDISENTDNAYYAWFVKGYALDYDGYHDEAIKCFEEAIKYCPDDAVEAWIAKGIALNYKNSYNEAIRCFVEAIKLGKKNIIARYQDLAYAYLNMSVSLYNLETNKEISKEVREEVSNCLTEAKSYADKSISDLEGNKEKVLFDCCLTEAKSYADKSISENPNDAHAWMIKGASYFKLGYYDMAIQSYDKIIMDINPEFDLAWCLKGYALNYLERYEEALKYFDEAIKINVDNNNADNNNADPDYYMGKGISLNGLEKYDEAIKYFDKAVIESAYQDVVFFLKGVSNYSNHWYIEALDDFGKVSCHASLDGQKHISIGACYYSIGLVEEARNEYKAAIKSNPKLAEAYYNLGVLNNNDGKTDIARKDFENCLGIDRKFTKAKEALEKLDSPSSTSDWFKWWFSNGEGKKVFGIILILSIFALIIFVIATNTYTIYHNQNMASNMDNQSSASQLLGINQNILSSTITGIIIMVGLLIVILVLPSLRRVKVSYIELEPVTIDTKIQQHMDAITSKVKFSMQSF